MKWTKFFVPLVFSFFISDCALSQSCPSLNSAPPVDLVSFLSTAAPDQDNAECIAWAIRTLGAQKYEPAISVIAGFLDFKRPPDELEKKGVYLRPPSIWEVYPAAAALDAFGEKALPTLVNVIKGESASEIARQNAIAVLMVIHKYDTPKGIALLKPAEVQTTDDSSKRRLNLAISTAVAKWCGPAEQASCKAVANKDEKQQSRFRVSSLSSCRCLEVAYVSCVGLPRR